MIPWIRLQLTKSSHRELGNIHEMSRKQIVKEAHFRDDDDDVVLNLPTRTNSRLQIGSTANDTRSAIAATDRDHGGNSCWDVDTRGP